MNVRSSLLATGLLAAGTILGFGIRTGLADGVPDKDPLYYSGSLTENGQLVTDTRTIGVNLYPDQTTMTPLCQTVASNTQVVNGRFRIPLAASCKSEINQNNGAWIEVIDGVTNLGRSKVGAVPYAIEADRAAGASGALASTISQLQSGVHTPSAFHAWVTTPVSIPGRSTTAVTFDHVEYDLSGEYNATNGVFSPKQPGVYLIQCSFSFGPAPTAASCAAAIMRNGAEVNAHDVPQGTMFNAGVEVTTMVQLAASDTVACAAFQNAASPQSLLSSAPERNGFSAARLY